jgi:hypothetical protein
MTNLETLQVIAGCITGGFIAFVIFNLIFGRTMTVVLGQRFKTQAGFFKALVLLCRDYWGGYSSSPAKA